MSFSILSTGRALPKTVLTNEELCSFVDTTDEWIRSRTGIGQRHVCMEESLTELATEAARRAMASAGVGPGDLDLILCATISSDYITPSLACTVQEAIGASCPAFDVSAACPGFLFALDVADGYFVLFGDGAGAVVLGPGEGLRSLSIQTQGRTDVLYVPAARGNLPGRARGPESYAVMDGQEVFKFAVTAMCRGLRGSIRDAGLSEADIDWVLPHQANMRIIEFAMSKMKIPRERFLINIERLANTSAACIPILLDESREQGKFKKGDLLAMCAFGAGLTSASAVIRWEID